MKYTNKLMSMAVLLSLFLAFGCKDDNGGDNGPVDPEIPGAALSGTWAAVRDNAISGPTDDIEAQFADFSITINANSSGVTYSTTNNGDPLVFPDSGTLAGVDSTDNFNNGAEVIRQPDNVDMTARVTDNGNTLTLNFTISTQQNAAAGNGRVAGIDGQYTFILDKQ